MSSALTRLREIRRQSSERTEAAMPTTRSLAAAMIHTWPLADYGTPEDADAIAWAEGHLSPDVLAALGARGRRCYEIAADETEDGLRHAVEQLAAVLASIRTAYAARDSSGLVADPIPTPPERWHVVVGAMNLRRGPIELDAARRVLDVPAFVTQTIANLESALELWNRGRPDTLVGRLVDEHLDHLRRCGVEVTVEATQ